MGRLWWHSWCWACCVLLRLALSEGVSLSLSNTNSSPFRFLAETSKRCVEKQQDVLWCDVTIELYSKTGDYTKGFNLCAEDPAVRMRLGFRDPSFLIRNITVDGVVVPRPNGGNYFMGDSPGVMEFHMNNLLKNTEVCQKEKHMRIILGLESTRHAAEVLSVKFGLWDGFWEEHDEDVIDESDVLDEPGSQNTQVSDTSRSHMSLTTVDGLAALDVGENHLTETQNLTQRFSRRANDDGDDHNYLGSGGVSKARAAPSTARVKTMSGREEKVSLKSEEVAASQSSSMGTQALGARNGVWTTADGMASVSERLVTHDRRASEDLKKGGKNSGGPKSAPVSLSFPVLVETSKACIDKDQDIVWCNVTIELYSKTGDYTKGFNLCAEDPAVRMQFGFRNPSFLIRNITVDKVPVPRPNGDEYFKCGSVGTMEFHMRSLLKKTELCKKEKHKQIILGIEATKHAAEVLVVKFNAWDGPLDNLEEGDATNRSSVVKEPHRLSKSIDATTDPERQTGLVVGSFMASGLTNLPPETFLTIGWSKGMRHFGTSTNDSDGARMNVAEGEAQGTSTRSQSDDESAYISKDQILSAVVRSNPPGKKEEGQYNRVDIVSVAGLLPKPEALRGGTSAPTAAYGLNRVWEEPVVYETTIKGKLARRKHGGGASEQRGERKDFIQSATITSDITLDALDEGMNAYQNYLGPHNYDGEGEALESSMNMGKNIHGALDKVHASSVGLLRNVHIQEGSTMSEDGSRASGRNDKNSGMSPSSKTTKTSDTNGEEPLKLPSNDLVYDLVWSGKGCSELPSSKTLCEVDATLPDVVNLCSTRRVSRLSIEDSGKTIGIVGITVDGVDAMEGLVEKQLWGNEFNWFTVLVGSKVCSHVTHRKVHLVLNCVPGGCQDVTVAIRRMRISPDEHVLSSSSFTTTGTPSSRARQEETSPPQLTATVASRTVNTAVRHSEETKTHFKTISLPAIDALDSGVGASGVSVAKKEVAEMPLKRALPDNIDHTSTAAIMSGHALKLASAMGNNTMSKDDLSVLYRTEHGTGCVPMSSDGSECMVSFQLEDSVNVCSKDRVAYFFGINYLMNCGKIKLLEVVVDDKKVSVSSEPMEKLSRSLVCEVSLVDLLYGTKICTSTEHRSVNFRVKCEEDACRKVDFYISRKRAELVQPSHSSNVDRDSHFSNNSHGPVVSNAIDGCEILSRSAVYGRTTEDLGCVTTSTALPFVPERMVPKGGDTLLIERSANQSEIKEKDATMAAFKHGGTDEVPRQKDEINAIAVWGVSGIAGSSSQSKHEMRQGNKGQPGSVGLVSDVMREAEPQSTGAIQASNKNARTHFRHNAGTTVAPVVQVEPPESFTKAEVFEEKNSNSGNNMSELPYRTSKRSGVSFKEMDKIFRLVVEETPEDRRFTLEDGAYDWCGADVPSRLVFCQTGLLSKPAGVYFDLRDEKVTVSVPMAEIAVPELAVGADHCYVLESCSSVSYSLLKMNCSKAIMVIRTNGGSVRESSEATLKIMPAMVLSNLEPSVVFPVRLSPEGLAYARPSVTCSSNDPKAVMVYAVWKRGKARFPICVPEGSMLPNSDAKSDKFQGLMYIPLQLPTKAFRTAEGKRVMARAPDLSCRVSEDIFNVRILRAILTILAVALYLY